MWKRKSICLITRISGIAGPASFQRRLSSGLVARGFEVNYRLDDPANRAALVIGGTRNLAALWRARKRGLRIVQRLNGMNWIHRRRPSGLKHALRAELNNRLLFLIRNWFADHVVYQSRFAQEWWERVYGLAPAPASVIHNAVPLEIYSPSGPQAPPKDRIRLLVVEGNLGGGYEIGLDWALQLALDLRADLQTPVELVLAGTAADGVQQRLGDGQGVDLRWLGTVPPERIPALDRSAHLLFAADLHPACPNSVIEALACGLPVVSYRTGALPELVGPEAGRLADYGSDPWRLESPDAAALLRAARELLADLPRFRSGARARAEAAFGLEPMLEAYLNVLLDRPSTQL